MIDKTPEDLARRLYTRDMDVAMAARLITEFVAERVAEAHDVLWCTECGRVFATRREREQCPEWQCPCGGLVVGRKEAWKLINRKAAELAEKYRELAQFKALSPIVERKRQAERDMTIDGGKVHWTDALKRAHSAADELVLRVAELLPPARPLENK